MLADETRCVLVKAASLHTALCYSTGTCFSSPAVLSLLVAMLGELLQLISFAFMAALAMT